MPHRRAIGAPANRRSRSRTPRVAALAALLAGAAAIGCGVGDLDEADRVAQAASPIEEGYTDRTTAAVAGVFARTPEGRRRICTGVLIDEDLVLTARHCIAGTDRTVDCGASIFGPSVLPPWVRVTFSPVLGEDASWIMVREIRVMPESDAVCGNDIALLVLAEPATGQAAPLSPRLDRNVGGDELYSAVGFGQTEDGNDDAGVRRRRDELHVLCVGDHCDSAVFDVEWRGEAGVCNGDSGGPAIDGSERVIGVASRGPSGCATPVYTGLPGFGGWLQREAVRAARHAGRTPAAWTGTRVASVEHEAEASGCSVTRSPPLRRKGSAAIGLGLAAILGAARRRRARRACRR